MQSHQGGREVLHSDYVRAPSCEVDWQGISRQLEQVCNFPRCNGTRQLNICTVGVKKKVPPFDPRPLEKTPEMYVYT